jgi:hypothetical protein
MHVVGALEPIRAPSTYNFMFDFENVAIAYLHTPSVTENGVPSMEQEAPKYNFPSKPTKSLKSYLLELSVQPS